MQPFRFPCLLILLSISSSRTGCYVIHHRHCNGQRRRSAGECQNKGDHTDTQTVREATTDERGDYLVPSLLPGTYQRGGKPSRIPDDSS